MHTFNLKQTRLTNGFFADWQQRNGDTTLRCVHERFAETGRWKALKCEKSDTPTHIFWDSDVVKWMEGAAYFLSRKEDEQIRAWYEEAVQDILTHQREDGYFNSYFQVYEPENIFKKRNDHELYCAGHAFEAAVAASEYLHDDRLLQFAEKYADYIYDRFVVKQDTAFKTPGHEEIELALLRLYRLTKKEKYKELAAFFLDTRGTSDDPDASIEHSYDQAHMPVRDQRSAEGHAVRALYLFTAMADMAILTGDEKMIAAVRALFDDIVEKKMYVTGGVGSTHCGEQFTVPYALPSYTAYAETCASIALVFFADKMLQLTGEKKYGDVLERALYNGVIAGVSLDGSEFFYVNPLEMQLSRSRFIENGHLMPWSRESLPITKRVKVFYCSCCPPNICRFLEEIPQYVWYADEQNATLTLSQHLSCALTSDFATAEVVSNIPYGGKVTIKLSSHGKKITLRVRKPEWCDLSFPNEKDGYLLYEGIFDNEEISLDFQPKLKQIYGNPLAADLSGKTALSYGPFVLCAEGTDNPFNLFGVSIGDISAAQITPMPDSPYALRVTLPVAYEERNSLYSYEKNALTEKTLTMIPYFAWANREANDMRVWFPVLR